MILPKLPVEHVAQIRVRLEEVRMVQRVEHLEAELQSLDSAKFQYFWMPMSQSKISGPMNIRRRTSERLQMCNEQAAENAAGLIQLLIYWFVGIGFTPGTTFGR